jgi:IPT/TIG domain
MRTRIALAFLCLAVAPSLWAAETFYVLERYPVEVREGTGSGTIKVVRWGGDLSVANTISYSWYWFFPGGQTGSGTLTFGPNDTSQTFTIPIPNDNVFTDGFSARVVLNDHSHITEGDVVAYDDDPPPTISGSNVSVAKGNSGTTAVTLHYTLSAPFSRLEYPYYRSPYLLFGGTAKKNVDYVVPPDPSATLNQTSFDVVVNINGNPNPEPDKTVVVSLAFYTQGFPVKGDGVITILNDKYLAEPALQIGRGDVGTFMVSTSVPSPSSERIELTSEDPSIADVPPFVDIPAGATSAAVPVTGLRGGVVAIDVKNPASRGGQTVTTSVTVVESTALAFDPATLTTSVGAITTVHAHFTPPPAAPITLLIDNSRPSVVDVPTFVIVGKDGNGSFSVRALSNGASDLSIKLPAEYGADTKRFHVDVSLPAGLSIGNLSVKSGPATGNQPVTLSGTNITGRCSITFGGVSALNTGMAANNAVSTVTPPHAAGIVDVAIRCGTAEFTLPGAYTYMAAPPRITGISPAAGSTSGGTIVTAAGQNLPRGRCALWFGSAPATTLTNVQATEISAIAPAHAAGLSAVVLRCGSDTSTLDNAFLFGADEPPATIATVNPPSGAPGDRVLVGGSRFRVDDTISFGTLAAIAMSTAPNEHFVTVPDLAAGAVPIALRDAAGRAVSGPSFAVKPPAPAQITAAPAKATLGAEIVVNGAGFRPSFSFVLGGVPLQRVVVTSSYAVLRVPKTLSPQNATLAVNDAAGVTLASTAMEVTSTGIAIDSVTPSCISTDGGTLVTIRGSGFAPGAVVTFGAADGTDVVVTDANTIVARAPASSGLTDVTVTVTNPSLASGQLTGAFQYRWPDSACGTARHRPARH